MQEFILARQQHHAIGEQVRRLLYLLAVKSAGQVRDSIEFLNAW